LIQFIKQLREKGSEENHIIVALIGKPNPETMFTSVGKQDLRIWQQKIALLADPCLQLAALVEQA